MFRAREHSLRIRQPVPLQASYGSGAQFLYDLWIFAIAFVRAAPPYVLRNCHTRCKSPIDTRRTNLFGRDAANLLDQCGISRAAESDIVRKDHRSQYIVVSVYRVDAVEQWNARLRLERSR